MNDPDGFGFGNIGPDTLETENQQEQEPDQESNTSTQQNSIENRRDTDPPRQTPRTPQLHFLLSH